MLLGDDVSKWQGDVNWEQGADAGLKFSFIRAGSISVGGTLYTDYQYEKNVSLGPDYMPIGCYWYYRPQHSPEAQARYFFNLLDGEEWEIPPVADIENDGGLSPAAYADSVKTFLDYLEGLVKVKPIIYTSRYKWSFVEPRPYWGDYDLWVAHYTLQSEPLLPEAWSEWKFWQYTAQGDGIKYGVESRYIDLDRFNGDEEDFREYLGNPFPPSPVLPPSIGVKVNIEIDGQDVKYQGHIEKVE
jgi:lysozyme